jgi:glucose-1-phosphate cytidylyltransferase
MKAVILAGGYGTRLSEETGVRPKPMVEIGEWPILWHIMKIYSAYGVNDFVICCGYKGHVIKQFFADYHLHKSDATFDLANQSTTYHRNGCEPWRVTLIDTGEQTMTGGRLRRVREYIGDETFFFTYGDGVCDVNLHDLFDFHREQQALVTVTAVQPPGRFGTFTLAEDQTFIHQFREKPQGDATWINGGFYVVEPEAIDYIDGDDTVWERRPMEQLAQEGRMAAFRHTGFWHPMDTLRDRITLEDLWKSGRAPWNVWSGPRPPAHADREIAISPGR